MLILKTLNSCWGWMFELRLEGHVSCNVMLSFIHLWMYIYILTWPLSLDLEWGIISGMGSNSFVLSRRDPFSFLDALPTSHIITGNNEIIIPFLVNPLSISISTKATH